MKVDILDKESKFVKRIFGIIKDGTLYTQETTDSNITNIDESKPLIIQNDIQNKIRQSVNMINSSIESNQSSIVAKGINFSFFPKAYANENFIEKNNQDRGDYVIGGLTMVALALDITAGTVITAASLSTLPVIIATAITIYGAKLIYQNSPFVRSFFDNPLMVILP